MRPHRRTSGLLAVLLGAATVSMAFSVAPAEAAVTDIRINEVSSNPTDFVELVNAGAEPVDIAGLTVADEGSAPFTIKAATTILQPGDLYSFTMASVGGPGLGKGDTVTIASGGTPVDSYTWPAGTHAEPSHGLCEGAAAMVLQSSATPGLANDCPVAEVVLNEVASNPNPDLVELLNVGVVPADISGWQAVDTDPTHANITFAPAGTVLEPGEYFTFNPDDAAFVGHFGLGSGDGITIFEADGTTVVDSYSYVATGAHATPSHGRCPDGTGDFVTATAATPGAANACPLAPGAADVKINEASSDPSDWVELTNVGAAPVDVSGWLLSDDAGTTDPTHLQAIPAGTTLAPGGFLAVDYTAAGFGKGDQANLYLPDGVTRADHTAWPVDTHATAWGRCPDGTGAFRVTVPTKGAANNCDAPPPPPELDPSWDDIEINEISSLNNGQEGTPIADAVELVNTGSAAVSIEGWWQTDSGAASGASALTLADLQVWNGTALAPATAMTVPAGGHVAFSSKKGLSGEGDAVKVYGPGATATERQLVDEASYGDGDAGTSDTPAANTGAKAFAACRDGSDDFWRVTVHSIGQDNTASCSTKHRPGAPLVTSVVLNEVSDVAGKAELLNTGTAPVDISGWTLSDDTGTVLFTVPDATTLAAGGFFLAEGITGLGAVDSLTVTRPGDGASFLGHSWTESGVASYSRCDSFGQVSYIETPSATWGAANLCPTLAAGTWPGGTEVTVADADTDLFTDIDSPQGGTNGEGDVSGVTFAEGGDVLWAVMNKGRLFKLKRTVAGTYDSYDPAWEGGVPLAFADGDGQPDSEGVTVGPDGALYITSERDNERNKSGSSNVVLRYDVSTVTASTGELSATHQWDVHPFVPTGSNLGLEGIAYVPDSFLVDSGWTVDGRAYAAADQPTPGLFATAVEGTGELHFFSLATAAAPVEVKVESSGFPFSMDVAYDADRQQLWTLCDDTCGGVYHVLKVDGSGDLAVTASYNRPAGMPNLNNEGMAIAPLSTAAAGAVAVIWADDGDTDGYSLRAGTLSTTAAPGTIVEVTRPGIAGTAKVGSTLTGTGGTTSPAAVTRRYQWLADGTPIAGATSSRLRLVGQLAGKRISLRVSASAAGYSDLTTVSAQTPAVARGTIVAGKPRITGKVKVGRTLTAKVATPSVATRVTYQWLAGGKVLRGRTAARLTLTKAVRGKRITLRVTYTATGYRDLTRVSSTRKVAR
ncbi:lamin tail domain-containing protein [Nocardioides sp. 1609]|uniref:lamin tail domain-containing protein n=1 Tax=Nocardioides sp. 1609 TaxID=2508327 RepID=UPI00142FEF70|nr:lamin tail domain-containing protein [Nocardioides sp. 1609]